MAFVGTIKELIEGYGAVRMESSAKLKALGDESLEWMQDFKDKYIGVDY